MEKYDPVKIKVAMYKGRKMFYMRSLSLK